MQPSPRRSQLTEPTVIRSDDDDENVGGEPAAILISSSDDDDDGDGDRGAAPAELVLSSSDDDDDITPAAAASGGPGLISGQSAYHVRTVPASPHVVVISSEANPRFRCPTCSMAFVAWGDCVKHSREFHDAPGPADRQGRPGSPGSAGYPYLAGRLNADGYECSCGERFTGWGDCRTHQHRSGHDCGPAEGRQQRCSLSMQAAQAPFLVTPWPPKPPKLSKHQRRRRNRTETKEWVEAEHAADAARAADAADAADAERAADAADAADAEQVAADTDALFFYDTTGDPGTNPADSDDTKRGPGPNPGYRYSGRDRGGKYQCDECGDNFEKWTLCSAHLRAWGHCRDYMGEPKGETTGLRKRCGVMHRRRVAAARKATKARGGDDASGPKKTKEKKKKWTKEKKKKEKKKKESAKEKEKGEQRRTKLSKQEKKAMAREARDLQGPSQATASQPFAPSAAAAHHPTCECKFACPTCFVGFAKWQGKSSLCQHAAETGHGSGKVTLDTCLGLGCRERKRAEKELRAQHHDAAGAAAAAASGNGVPSGGGTSVGNYVCPDCRATFGSWSACSRHCEQLRHAGWPKKKGLRKRCRPDDIVAAAGSAAPKFKCPDCGLMYHKFAGIADHAKAKNHAGWDGGAGYNGLMERCNAEKLSAQARARKAKRRPDDSSAAPAPAAAPITSGVGHRLLKMMGWKDGDGLGKKSEGRVEPVSATITSQGSRDKRGLGQADGDGGGGGGGRKNAKRKRGRDQPDGGAPWRRSGPAPTEIQGFARGRGLVPGDAQTAGTATAAPVRKSSGFVPRQVGGVASRRPNPIGVRGSRGAGHAHAVNAGHAGRPHGQPRPMLPPPPPRAYPAAAPHGQSRGWHDSSSRPAGAVHDSSSRPGLAMQQQQQPGYHGYQEGGPDRMYESYR